jgi:anti-sigma regulatory factor (Ser/Thr protein kinase)
MARDDRTVTVRAPAIPSSVGIVRSVAANVAAVTEVPYDVIEDLRLAVTEACNRLLDRRRGDGTLTLDIVAVDGVITVRVSIDARADAGSREQRVMPWQIIEALTMHAEETFIDGRPTISMQVGSARSSGLRS